MTASRSATGSARNTAKALSAKKGENINKGDQQDDLAQHRQEQRGLGVAQGDEGLLAGDLDAEDAGGTHIDPQRPDGVIHQLGAVVENQNEHPGEQLHQDPQSHGVDHAGPQQAPEGIPHPLGIVGAEVVADDGLGTLCEIPGGASWQTA